MNLHQLVKELEEQQLPEFMHLPTVNPRPSREAVFAVTHDLQCLLFPGYFDHEEMERESLRYLYGNTLERVRRELTQQVMRALCFRCQEPGKVTLCKEKGEHLVDQFLADLPRLRRALSLDAEAAYRGDPSADSPEEVIFSFPGMKALIHHRLAHRLVQLEVPLIPRMMAERAHSLTGIDIHPGAQIGEGFFIDHGTGVVIGATAEIGKNVRIYQGVTLGAKSFPTNSEGELLKGRPRHPIVEDDVVIYAGATVLGRITIGAGSVIGGNVWLTESLPPRTRIAQGKNLRESFEHGSGI